MKDTIYIREALPQSTSKTTPLHRLEKLGAESMRDGELLMVCLGLSHEKIKEITDRWSLAKLVTMPYPELKTIFGKARASKWFSAVEITKRALNMPVHLPLSICSPVGALPYFSEIKGKDKEHFKCLYLNARNQVIHHEIISIGSLSASIVHPREVFKVALEYSAASVILGHNHPSGNCSPSQDDVDLTRRLAQAGEIIGIDIIDHVIISSSDFLSMKERGLI